MRQAGIIAAAGIYALRHNVDRLAEDHANARRFATRIAGAPGIQVYPDAVETNIVRIDGGDALESVVVESVGDGEQRSLDIDLVFV